MWLNCNEYAVLSIVAMMRYYVSKQSTLHIQNKNLSYGNRTTYTKALKISSQTTPLFVFARPNNVILTLRVIKAFE